MEYEIPDLSVLRRCWSDYKDESRTHEVEVNGVSFGGEVPVIIAGPCAVESLEHTLTIARDVRRVGVRLMRGGVYKPRTSPHSFQGLGEEGLEILDEVRRLTGLGIVTEVMDPRLVEQVAAVADMLQIGSRSMQNFPLLTEVGKTRKPVLLKRGWNATLEEWLCAAEYIAKQGNRNIVLCERGIRTSCNSDYSRNVLDLNVIEPLRRLCPLPIIVDPSHATGAWRLVAAMSHAALASGAQGLLIEVVHREIDRAKLKCDAEQGVPPGVLAEIVESAFAFPPCLPCLSVGRL
ncbi:MAG: 3-deoxy-7-phosphoheptulonate synthase [Acidobacteriota bacterium]|nr:3-deoxy-7-phosphoheptulonate synthase [Acidobacteriota bacterium]MDH3786844.1 3-deoxy-7-phosphoheptulonate synthase [Acidobacteriota bacterium]